jgi:hypothetical protein
LPVLGTGKLDYVMLSSIALDFDAEGIVASDDNEEAVAA